MIHSVTNKLESYMFANPGKIGDAAFMKECAALFWNTSGTFFAAHLSLGDILFCQLCTDVLSKSLGSCPLYNQVLFCAIVCRSKTVS